MSSKKILLVGIQALALGVILTISFMIAGYISGVGRPQKAPPAQATSEAAAPARSGGAQALPGPEWKPPTGGQPAAPVNPEAAARTLFFVCLAQGVVFTYLILRSRWSGWKLAGAVFLALFGVGNLHAGIETAVYLRHVAPRNMPADLLLMGIIEAALFAPLAVLVLGKIRWKAEDSRAGFRPKTPPLTWIWKSLAAAVAYLFLYYLFGYYVAWKNPAVRTFYGGTDPGSFFKQVALVASAQPWMLPLQALRGFLYVLFTLPVIRMLKGRPWETALALGLLYSVVGGLMLLMPNPYFPDAVRMAHLVETTSENFLFGAFVGWLFSQAPASGVAKPLVESVA